jgi:2-octaprenyl-6-methoxyphenol hydroxylase
MTRAAPAPDRTADLLVAGGGMAGMTLAVACAEAGLSTVVVDTETSAAQLDAAFDGRVSAVALAACRMLKGLGLWPDLEADAQPILDIRVSDGRPGARPSSLFLHFDHSEIGDEPFGHMIENRVIRRALDRAADRLPNLVRIAPATVARVETGPDRAIAHLADGRTIAARLVAAADGRKSRLREAAGIRTTGWSYGQTGIVTTVAHALPHHGTAHEHFLPAGPFAILPMRGDRSSLVWTERDRTAAALMKLPKPDLDAEIGRRFGDHLGAVESVGPRWSYPLAFHLAERFAAPRLVLVGDAAHGIHPIAGQGLNLGLRDVAALAEVLVDGHRLGMEVGDATLLARYERWRRVDSVVLGVVTDGLTRLFSNDLAPVRLARDLGLAAVERMGPVKRFFMRHASGNVGTLPRLLEGRPL